MSDFCHPHQDPVDQPFSKEIMIRYLSAIGDVCHQQGKTMEIAMFGGSALMLLFEYREATCDIDFIPVFSGAHDLAAMGDSVAVSVGLPMGVLRDDVSIFASDFATYNFQGEFPIGSSSGCLRVFTATPEYILAMKLFSMRSSLETRDVEDVWHLLEQCKITKKEEAVAVVQQFYPDRVLPRRHVLILEDVLESRSQKPRPAYSASLGW